MRTTAVGTHARGGSDDAVRRKLVAEFIGTFFLVFTVGAATSRTGAGALAPLAIGAVLMAMVFAGGHVSGAHYNPAVTVAVMIRGRIKPRKAFAYVVVQLLAAGSAGALIRAINGVGVATPPASIWKILIVEFLFTLALAYVMLNVATSAGTRDNSFYGLAIGFTVVAGALAVGGISGAAFNPAVAVGASVIGRLEWGHIWIYVLANTLGGAAAAAAFLYVNGGGDTRATPRQDTPARELSEMEVKSQ